jgi:hypothetical protein
MSAICVSVKKQLTDKIIKPEDIGICNIECCLTDKVLELQIRVMFTKEFDGLTLGPV